MLSTHHISLLIVVIVYALTSWHYNENGMVSYMNTIVANVIVLFMNIVQFSDVRGVVSKAITYPNFCLCLSHMG